MNTSELTGAALDWAVAKCEVGADFIGEVDDPHFYSTDWAQGGPIIEREKIALMPAHPAVGGWTAAYQGKDYESDPSYIRWERVAETPLIAAMRCYVASKLGAEVNIPEELL